MTTSDADIVAVPDSTVPATAARALKKSLKEKPKWKIISVTLNHGDEKSKTIKYAGGNGRYTGVNPLQAAKKAFNQLCVEHALPYDHGFTFVMKEIGDRKRKARVYVGTHIKADPVIRPINGKNVVFKHENRVSFVGVLDQTGNLIPKKPRAEPKTKAVPKTVVPDADPVSAEGADPVPAQVPDHEPVVLPMEIESQA